MAICFTNWSVVYLVWFITVSYEEWYKISYCLGRSSLGDTRILYRYFSTIMLQRKSSFIWPQGVKLGWWIKAIRWKILVEHKEEFSNSFSSPKMPHEVVNYWSWISAYVLGQREVVSSVLQDFWVTYAKAKSWWKAYPVCSLWILHIHQ